MHRRAFTLVELLVVIAIVGLLSTVAVVALNSSRANARNAKRKADLIQISKALELYYAYNNAYPTTVSTWFSVAAGGGSKTDADPGDYPTTNTSWIPGLTAGGFMERLPRDPTTGVANNTSNPYCEPSWSGYFYISNGIDYKVSAICTPEGGDTPSSDPFYDPSQGGAYWRYSVFTPGAALWP